jgi:putative transposase
MDVKAPATFVEIAAVLGITKRGAEKRAEREGWKFSEKAKAGQSLREYALADLPKDVQHALYVKRFAEQAVVETVAVNTVVELTQSKQLALTDTDVAEMSANASQDQRSAEQCIKVLMRFIESFEGSQLKAVMYLNTGYLAGSLPSTLVYALENSRFKASGKAKNEAVLSIHTVNKWAAKFAKTGSYLPQVRAKDLSLKSWHVDLVRMLDANRQKRCYTQIHEALTAAHPEVSYDAMLRWVREKYSRMDVIRGQSTGMQLRAKQAYQPRTSAGLMPWDEVHADGWTTHFTAPHPITGEFVTYEIWDFHDVATRYVPPYGIGLSECYEVIAKGIENAIRDNGVMCILQTDSTKIVKKNVKFVGNPVMSIADKAGFTIVHPVTVGNAQANGISENYHTWMDKQSRTLATYQAKGQDSLTLRNVKKITAEMVKAANKGQLLEREKLHARAERIGGGVVFKSYQEAIDWLEGTRQRWNNHPHSSLKKVRDTVSGKLRHQTPQECLDEFKANGWQPVKMDEAILADLFRVHVEVSVRRGMVSPYGGMLFKAHELGSYEGEKVVVAYDSMDYSQVWVKTLRGELICVANFVEATGYRAVTAYESAQEKRALAQIKNKEKGIERIKARAGLDSTVMDSEIVLQRVELMDAELVCIVQIWMQWSAI